MPKRVFPLQEQRVVLGKVNRSIKKGFGVGLIFASVMKGEQAETEGEDRINLCRWGYVSGYITEKETWDLIMPVARMPQASFSSWKEYAYDYLLGREFWSFTQTVKNGKKHKEAVKALMKESGVWSQKSWALQLGPGPVAKDRFLLSVK